MKFKVNGVPVQYMHCDSIDRPRIITYNGRFSLRKSGKWLAVNGGYHRGVDFGEEPYLGGELKPVDHEAAEFMRLLANGWKDGREYARKPAVLANLPQPQNITIKNQPAISVK